ncbi:MAG TPA: asparaginase [Chloroflexia bacterium]|nr:asparaginase [Chloroflexia bacterium]
MHADPKHNPERSPAVLIEVTRGPIVESVHYGVIAVADAAGDLLAWAGNPGTDAYYRSASKPIQALPLVESGAADHFGLTERELAVTCGSHGGEDIHIEAVTSILNKIGLEPDALACGIHMPYDKDAARELEERGGHPTVLHNNCSGKHAGMLALAKFHGWPVGGYEMARHPVQKLMLETVGQFADLAPEDIHVGVDGCGVSTFGISVLRMAMSFARFAQPDAWPEPRRSALRRIAAAMVEHPEMVAARRGRIDTDIMRAAGGTLIAKAGAEGIYCVAQLATDASPAIGFAMKLLDGDPMGRARNPAVVEGLRQAGLLDEEALGKLEKYWMEEVRNRPGDIVGMVRPAFTLSTSG